MATPERPDDEAIEAELVETTAEVVRLVDFFEPTAEGDTADEEQPAEAAPAPALPNGPLARRVAAIAERPILRLAHAKAAARWWARALWRSAAYSATHPHVLVGRELRPIGHGVAVAWRGWRRWVTEAEYAATLASSQPGAAGREKAAAELAKMRSGHRKLSTVVALLTITGLTVLFFLDPWLLGLVGFTATALFDFVGRQHRDRDAPIVVRRTVLEEGAPLGALAKQVVTRLNEDGVRADLAGPMTVHEGGEYRLQVVHEDAIEPKHLRSLERHLAAPELSIRLVGSRDAGTSELRLPTRDHLASVAPRAWAPTGSRSIAEPADLWVRSDGHPSSPVLAGVHVDMVGTTGAGKTEALQELISFMGECRDVYPVFVDLTRGPVGPLNKNVLRRKAYTVEEAHALLDWVLALIDERHDILHRLAESDDPDDDDAPVEWSLAWGPQVEVINDEYSFTAADEELHEKFERGMRVGRKVKVCFVRASQKSGNKDLGSTLAQALVGLKILLACEESDTVRMLSTTHRDRGWSPHALRPAVPGEARDAGKCFVWGPSHRDPEIHRFHAPLPPGEIKARDRQRAADGLPNLDGTPAGEQPAMLLSPVQVEVERIFADRGGEWLPTSEISAELAGRGHVVKPADLAAELSNAGSKRDWGGKRQIRGYAIADIRRAWGFDE